ncbi:MAG: phosphate signaling complex protein PhoU [Verrucomicrobiaceae bacterium]|nr:phosphate signaling complex protein PhoU [Verrucomicrobiaceae bacterium]
MTEPVHILGNFGNALRDARNTVLRMASIAEQNLEYSVRGLLTRNTDLCNEAIAEEDEVNQLERLIDADSFEILIRFNPVAGDLREVIAGMKVANNIERISDEAQNIARRARKVLKHPEIPEALLIEPVYEKAVSLFRDAMKAYAEGNTELAMSLYERDRDLDEAHSDVIRELSKGMDKESGRVKQMLHLIFMVRSLERVGDHAVNIGEDAVFLADAEDIRHLGHKRAAKRRRKKGSDATPPKTDSDPAV